ncbi:hypothetical protein CB1_000886005 [Camelus ferus]|nr:hypothetical protein CB1_000886005 [Camelus ferus]
MSCFYNRLKIELLDVVSQLAKQNLHVLVLGRKHMLTQNSRWRKDDMEKVQKHASCFFADNISEDDPYLLYATLHSGNHCKFITNDLMRDHKACLPDARTQHLFFKWQQAHQLAITSRHPGSKITFQWCKQLETHGTYHMMKSWWKDIPTKYQPDGFAFTERHKDSYFHAKVVFGGALLVGIGALKLMACLEHCFCPV